MPRYVIRIVFALFLIPVPIGLVSLLFSYLRTFSPSYMPFLFGVVCYTFTYPVFKKPLFSYVIGHELSHVLGVWLSRGRIHSFNIGRRGGTVKVDRVNIWTALLPYFFPIYTFLVLCIYFLLSILWDMSRFQNWLVFIIGITWAFHLWMTMYVLRHSQPDLRFGGFLFSSIIIFTVNIAILILLLVFISPELSILNFIYKSIERIKGSYLWILRRLM